MRVPLHLGIDAIEWLGQQEDSEYVKYGIPVYYREEAIKDFSQLQPGDIVIDEFGRNLVNRKTYIAPQVFIEQSVGSPSAVVTSGPVRMGMFDKVYRGTIQQQAADEIKKALDAYTAYQLSFIGIYGYQPVQIKTAGELYAGDVILTRQPRGAAVALVVDATAGHRFMNVLDQTAGPSAAKTWTEPVGNSLSTEDTVYRAPTREVAARFMQAQKTDASKAWATAPPAPPAPGGTTPPVKPDAPTPPAQTSTGSPWGTLILLAGAAGLGYWLWTRRPNS